MRRWLWLFLAATAFAAPAFRIALPGYRWSFPADDGPHPEFANEWWYFTGNLHTPAGRPYGFELTFFRISPAPGTPLTQQLFFTHFAVTDPRANRFAFHERAHRGSFDEAGAGSERLWSDNWTAGFDKTGPRALAAAWGPDQLALDLTPALPERRVLNGRNGWSAKGSAPGQASYYYSIPRLAARGRLDGAAVAGDVWMDHEFASSQLDPKLQGWDWMGLQLDDGSALMLFYLRRVAGGEDQHSAGTWIPAAGPPRPLTAADFKLTPRRYWHGYPVAWRVQVAGLDLAVDPLLDAQGCHAPASNVVYWEGAVHVSGTSGGHGYLELTGYGKRFDRLP